MIAKYFARSIIAFLLGLSCSEGKASTIIGLELPNPEYTANLNSNTPVYSSSPFNESTATWSVSQKNLPNPAINAQGNNVTSNLTVEVTMEYYFELVNISDQTAAPIPLLTYITGGISLTASGTGASYGNFGLVDESKGSYLINDDLTCASFDLGGCGTSNVNYQGNLMTNTMYYMELDAEASSYYSSSSATVDPVIRIDPSDPNSAYYMVITSPGVGNTPSAIPEPTTWVMMILGFTCIGIVAFQQKRFKSRKQYMHDISSENQPPMTLNP
jgi:hypothetical protein